jgi:hypothetical protein
MGIMVLHFVTQPQTIFTPQTFKLLANPVIGSGTAIEIPFGTLKFSDQTDLDEIIHLQPGNRRNLLNWIAFLGTHHSPSK